MTQSAQELAPLYVEALRDHLTGVGEEALHRAYELGRLALASGLGVVDLVLLHHGALGEILRAASTKGDLTFIGIAADFLAECLSPFEMTLRGYQETNARLGASNADLTRANLALAAAHDALKTEVTERKRAEAALAQAQKLQAIGLLAGGVAHHFNNLLTVVLGNLQLARRRLDSGENIERFLVSATSGAERGAEVVKQLLTFSRQQVLETRVLDTAQWMASARTLLASALCGDIAVEVQVAEATWSIRTDPAQLDLALLNLAVNARDAMPDGGILRVSAFNQSIDDQRLGLEGDYVVIAVADTGTGVDPQIVERVFEPFFTTKELGPGAGLGLSQVHGFVHQSGGAVDLETVIGEGTTFLLYLPAAREESADAAQESGAASRELDASGRVLVVDDDVEVADLTGQLLEGCGYAVTLAHRAKVALDLLGAGETVDLVLSDIIMPDSMDGVQLAEELRQRFPKVPVLLTTGYSEAMPAALEKGLPVITKPYDGHALCERVRELMRSDAR